MENKKFKNMKMTETSENRQTSGRFLRSDFPQNEHSKNAVTVKTKRKALDVRELSSLIGPWTLVRRREV